MRANPAVRALLETFPGAEIVDVRAPAEVAPLGDEGTGGEDVITDDDL